MLATLAEGGIPGSLDRSQVSGYMDELPTHPWSIAVAHDGVFKITLLTLFDLPLERFWMWSFDLCGFTVIKLRSCATNAASSSAGSRLRTFVPL